MQSLPQFLTRFSTLTTKSVHNERRSICFRHPSRRRSRLRAVTGCGGGGGNGGIHHPRFLSSSDGGHWHQPIFASLFASSSEDRRLEQKKKSKEGVILLTLCSFAVTRAAFSRITKKFIKFYEEQTGREVRFRLSYGGSGVQARAVIDGLPADIVALALPLDVIKIQQAGLIDKNWQKRTTNDGVFAESVVSIVVRKGNPLGIEGWADLTRDNIQVITANPKTAGVARWNFLALWGHKMKTGEQNAIDFVTQVFQRVPVQPRDAREASDVFYNQKLGDALLTYENEVFMTNLMVGEKESLPYVVPDNNIRVEASVAIVDKNMRSRSEATQEAGKAFVDYLFTPDAQKEFVACGFRSVNEVVRKESKSSGTFPEVKTQWTVDQKLGGWLTAQKKFFDADQILDEIQINVAQRQLEIEKRKN